MAAPRPVRAKARWIRDYPATRHKNAPPLVDMPELTIALMLLPAGFFVGWNIGANDAANCIGTMVGARILSFRRAALLMGIFVILGGVLQGHHVMKTVGKGILITSPQQYEKVHDSEPPRAMNRHFPDQRLPDLAVFVALISAGLFVTLAPTGAAIFSCLLYRLLRSILT